MAALAVCAVTAALLRRRTSTQAAPAWPGQSPPAAPAMIPLTIPEAARLLASPPPPAAIGHWLTWRRRRHQALAAWYHQRARLARDATIAQLSPGLLPY